MEEDIAKAFVRWIFKNNIYPIYDDRMWKRCLNGDDKIVAKNLDELFDVWQQYIIDNTNYNQ